VAALVSLATAAPEMVLPQLCSLFAADEQSVAQRAECLDLVVDAALILSGNAPGAGLEPSSTDDEANSTSGPTVQVVEESVTGDAARQLAMASNGSIGIAAVARSGTVVSAKVIASRATPMGASGGTISISKANRAKSAESASKAGTGSCDDETSEHAHTEV